MANVYETNKTRNLTRFLKLINQADNPELLRKEAHYLLASVHPSDIETAEQNLLNDGYSAHTVRLLSATFMLMAIPKDQSVNLRASLPANHILRTVIAEHDLIRCFLADLNELVHVIQSMNYLSDISAEFRRLAHITEHLDAMKEHFQREEDIIFPYLIKYGHISLCKGMQNEHSQICIEIENLLSLIVSFNEFTTEQFKAALVAVVRRLASKMQEHISQEDIILYPIALSIIKDPGIWKRIKALCNELGYCGVHL